MSAHEDIWAARLHAAVDDHPGALAFDVPSYVAAGRKRARRRRAAALAAHGRGGRGGCHGGRRGRERHR